MSWNCWNAGHAVAPACTVDLPEIVFQHGLGLHLSPGNRLPAFQDGAHHGSVEQDRAFFYCRHMLSLAAMPAVFEVGMELMCRECLE